ncbi:MAG: Reticulon-domain-containing protein [Benjaminiella poitrasii]|nr:MAG: Reticulon-domain-containing protein [Benjaminiella poitrasii]
MTKIAHSVNHFDLRSGKMKKKLITTLPSPRLSEDDLIHSLGIPIPISPLASESSKLQVFSETDSDKNELDKRLLLLYTQIIDLIYWKIPGRSAIVLGGILLSFILTSYYSLLYAMAASFTILTGSNLVFVNAYRWIHSIWTGLPINNLIHPYNIYIHQKPIVLLSRNTREHTVHTLIDILEIVVQKTARIVLVKDSKVTAIACLVSAYIYLTTSIISSTKTVLGLLVLKLFTLPYYYERHEDDVDRQWWEIQDTVKTALARYLIDLRRDAIIIYEQTIKAMNALIQCVKDRQKST